MPGRDLTEERELMKLLVREGPTYECRYCQEDTSFLGDYVLHLHGYHGVTVTGQVIDRTRWLTSYVIHEEPI